MGLLGNWLPEDPDKNAAARQGLLAAGAAMMSGKGNFVGMLGEGLGVGSQTYQGALAQQQQDRLRKAQQQRWDMENQQNKTALDRKRDEEGIIASYGDPGSMSGAAGVPPTSGNVAMQAPLGQALLSPPSDLPRIGQPRRPPAIDRSLEGAPGGMGALPSAFTPGEPPLPALPSLGDLPKKGQPRPASFARDAYERNLAIANGLLKNKHVERANEFFAKADKFAPEVKETVPMRTTDGRQVMVNRFKDGSVEEVKDYVPEDPKLTYQDVGGETLGLDPRGKVVVRFKNSERPGSRSHGGAGGASAARDGTLDSETLDMMADQALRGDRSVFQNIGRGAQGSANLVSLRQRITQKAKTQGITGADLASITADYSGQQAGLRTSGTISARIENAAAEAAQLAPLAIEAGRNVSRSGFLPFGKAQVMFDTKTNDAALNKFATANIGLATAYASAMARGQKATVSDMHEARELLTTAKSQEAYEAIVSQMQQEIAAAQRAPQHVRENLRGQISGRGGDHGAPAGEKLKVKEIGDLPKRPPAVGTVDSGHRFKGGNPADPKNWEKVR